MAIRKYTKIIRPLDYLRVKHAEKRVYDFVVPLILTVVSLAVIWSLPRPVAVFGPDSLVALVTGLTRILTGFFIASLAAVATFNKEDMDVPMLGTPPTLLRFKSRKLEKLSRRRFLSLMFGYLAFMSLFLYLFGGFAQLLSDNLRELIAPAYWGIFRCAFLFFYLLLLFNVVSTALLGLYYMADRIHRSNQAVSRGTELATTTEYSEDDEAENR